jgi:hypothetical protein
LVVRGSIDVDARDGDMKCPNSQTWCENMRHFKVIGMIWLVMALVGVGVLGLNLCSMAADKQYGFGTGFYGTGFWVVQFSAEGFLIAGALLGIGLLRFKRWAAIGTRITSALLLLYCLIFIVFSGFGLAWLIAGLFGLAFSAYSSFVVWRFRPYERVA